MEQNLSTEEKDVEIPEQVEVTAEAGKEEAEKMAAANNEGAPPARENEAEQNMKAEVDPFDPKLMEEILKYNKKREELNAKAKAELEK